LTSSGQHTHAFLFPNGYLARSAQSYIISEEPAADVAVHAFLRGDTDSYTLHAVLVPDSPALLTRARQFWQHTGWGVSSRFSAACLDRLGILGNCQDAVSLALTDEIACQARETAKRELQELIAGWACPDPVQSGAIGRASAPGPDDVFLYPGGMSSIYVLHHVLLQNQRQARKSVCFGYVFQQDFLPQNDVLTPSGLATPTPSRFSLGGDLGVIISARAMRPTCPHSAPYFPQTNLNYLVHYGVKLRRTRFYAQSTSLRSASSRTPGVSRSSSTTPSGTSPTWTC